MTKDSILPNKPPPSQAKATTTTGGTTKPEKRLKQYRSKPTIKITERIQRAISQRLYLINTSPITTTTYPQQHNNNNNNNNGQSITFHVLGSTGNVYDVTICRLPSCTCIDHSKGNLCKHILFVMLKVIGLHPSSNLVYQAAYVTSEVDELIDRWKERQIIMALGCDRDVTANEAVQAQYAKIQKSGNGNEVEASNKNDDDIDNQTIAKRKEVTDTSECPICFDPLGTNNIELLLTFCQSSCGNNFHVHCMKMWTSQCRGGDPTCPACRQLWIDPKTGGKRKSRNDEDGTGSLVNHEGYVNLGALQGQRQRRDTSTYHSPSKWRKY